jgi:hypothetical protein
MMVLVKRWVNTAIGRSFCRRSIGSYQFYISGCFFQLTVPSKLVALMSAVKLPSKEACSSEESCEATSQHMFKQAVPIPSYLIAIVVGRLEGR